MPIRKGLCKKGRFNLDPSGISFSLPLESRRRRLRPQCRGRGIGSKSVLKLAGAHAPTMMRRIDFEKLNQ